MADAFWLWAERSKKVVVDPTLPPEIQEAARELVVFPRPADSPHPAVAGLVKVKESQGVYALLIALILGSMAGMWWLVLGGGSIFAALVLVWLAGALPQRRRNRTYRRLWEARDRIIRKDDLSEDARVLLSRAQHAARTVARSKVHRDGQIDRAHNEIALPAQEWEIAERLADYTRLTADAPENAAGEKDVAVLAARSAAIREGLAGIQRRVEALEAYATQVAEADDRYAEWLQLQRIGEGEDDVRDFIARSVADDLAVAEIEGMTSQAEIITRAYTEALEEAKRAAVAALPRTIKAA